MADGAVDSHTRDTLTTVRKVQDGIPTYLLTGLSGYSPSHKNL